MENAKKLIEKIAAEIGNFQYDVIATKEGHISLSAHKGDLEKYQVSSSNIVGIRVIKNNKVGISYSEALDEDSLRFMIEQALNNSQLSKEAEFESISVKGDSPVVDSNHLTYIEDTNSIEDKIELCLELEKKIFDKADDVKCPYNGVVEVNVERLVFNSLGLERRNKNKFFSCYSSALFNREDKSGLHYKTSCSRTFKELDMDICINESFEVATNLLNATPIETGKYNIIFAPDQLDSLLSIFSNCFSAQEVIDKTNPWSNKLSQKVAHESLTIIDSPRVNGSFNYVTFDSEGAIPEDLPLIENGVLKSFLHNSKTSHQLSQKNNGRASRSAKTALNVSGTNTVIRPGSQNVRTGNFLELFSLAGLHSGANPISGDFSFGASGYLYTEGKITQTVKGITVSGNYYDMINNLTLGSDVKTNTHQNFHAPDILFKDLNVAGE